MNMHWEQSNLNPPTWWQLSTELKPVDVLIRKQADGYHVFIGGALGQRTATKSTLASAKAWAIREARKSLVLAQRELKPDTNPLPWVCLLGMIALGLAWRLLFQS